MNDLAVFQFSGVEVRVVDVEGAAMFVAADVCVLLGYGGGARNAVTRLPERMKGVAQINTPGGQQQMTVLTESGVNRLIMRSTLGDAERVQDWLAEDVMPTIRRTGSYGTPQLDLGNRDHIALIITAGHAALSRAVEAEARVAELEGPAEAWIHLAQADGDYDVAGAAKVLARDLRITIGRDRLFTVMAEMGWTYREKSSGRWQPKQTQIDLGRLSVLPKSHYHPRTGELVLGPPQVRVTAKGVEALHSHLSKRALPAVAS